MQLLHIFLAAEATKASSNRLLKIDMHVPHTPAALFARPGRMRTPRLGAAVAAPFVLLPAALTTGPAFVAATAHAAHPWWW